MANTFIQESVEFQPIEVKVDGTVVTSGVEFGVTALGARPPASWVAPTALSGKIGIMVSGYAVGTWQVWAKVTSAPETPILDCGYFIVE